MVFLCFPMNVLRFFILCVRYRILEAVCDSRRLPILSYCLSCCRIMLLCLPTESIGKYFYSLELCVMVGLLWGGRRVPSPALPKAGVERATHGQGTDRETRKRGRRVGSTAAAQAPPAAFTRVHALLPRACWPPAPPICNVCARLQRHIYM